jgi:hypothetical protein
MREVDWLKSMDRGAGRTPSVDVAQQVMRELRSAPPRPNRVYALAAAASLIAACAAFVIVQSASSAPQEPLADLTGYFDLVLR